MPESASGLMTEVAALTHATTQLLNTVNVRKATLDASVDAASDSASSAANSAQSASQSAASAATTLDETEAARDTTQTYRDQAVAVVTSNDGSFDSAPGKVPVAGLDGKIDYDYLPLASQNAIVAEALIRIGRLDPQRGATRIKNPQDDLFTVHGRQRAHPEINSPALG